MVDKDLFLHNLAVVSIMKNEEPYVKEWLDYHLLAGVDHFYLYDNDSTAEFKKILQPYIDAGIVTYTFFGGKCRQMEAYVDAVKRFRFFCRYIAWIDGDEFIFPKSKPTIVEVIDEILTQNPNASGVAVNIHTYGSNYQDKADYTRGLLERFTRHARNDYTPDLSWAPGLKGGSASVSSIANPRTVKFFTQPHAPTYFEGCNAVNEKGNVVRSFSSFPVSTEKIVMNHYHSKSFEEYEKKVQRGNADFVENHYSIKNFSHDKYNDEFDDGILMYQKARQNALIPMGGGTEKLFPSKRINYERLVNALIKNLFPVFLNGTSPNFFYGKVENFLTCLRLSSYLKGKFIDADSAKFFEELSLKALHRALYANLSLSDVFLLIDEMPEILSMNHPTVDKIREMLLVIIPQIMLIFRMNNHWQGFTDLEHELKFLKTFDALAKLKED